MDLESIQKKALILIQQGRFADVAPLLEQAVNGADNHEKESLIPLAEALGLECYYEKAGFFAAGECYRLAADLAAAVFGESDSRSIQKLRRTANHYAGPDYHLTQSQKHDSAARAVELSQRLFAVLEQHRPDDLEALADCAVLEVFCLDWNTPLTNEVFQEHKDLYYRTLDLTAKAYGPESSEFGGQCQRVADFLKTNGQKKQAAEFQTKYEQIAAALGEL